LGIDTNLFHPTGTPRENYALGLGSFTREKGPDLAVRAIATIPPEKRPSLVWVGNISSIRFSEETQSLASSLGVKLVLRIGVSDEEVVDLLNRAAVLIYTSVLEPFGFAPLEAGACGTPVVAVAEAGVRETVEQRVNGLLVPDRDPQKIGDAVTQLLDAPELAAQLGRRGRDLVSEKWTWDAAIDRLEDYLFAFSKSR
jgi:glycosyltransferase involved in cell wall biosynthesis